MDVQVFQRQDYASRHCMTDWRNYDKVVLETYLSQVGCRSPYHVTESNYSVCSNKEKMKQSLIWPSDIAMKKFPIPCRSLEKVYSRYDESTIDTIPNGTFEMKFYFNRRYTETVQYPQINAEVGIYSILFEYYTKI